MAEILAVGAYELFPAQEASSSERKNGAKYVITRYNLTYVSPFWNSAGRQDSPKIMSEGYSQIVHYGLSSRSMKYSSASFSSFPENGYLKLEEGYTDKIAKDLEKMGHKILRPDQPVGGAQAIIYDMNNDILIGGSDPRKDGCALGY